MTCQSKPARACRRNIVLVARSSPTLSPSKLRSKTAISSQKRYGSPRKRPVQRRLRSTPTPRTARSSPERSATRTTRRQSSLRARSRRHWSALTGWRRPSRTWCLRKSVAQSPAGLLFWEAIPRWLYNVVTVCDVALPAKIRLVLSLHYYTFHNFRLCSQDVLL